MSFCVSICITNEIRKVTLRLQASRVYGRGGLTLRGMSRPTGGGLFSVPHMYNE